jgi:inorganic triphosphatase YgiF
MDGAPKEIELKLRVDAEDVVALFDHPRFASALRDPVQEPLRSVYFDSDNRCLYKHGISLRVRHIGRKRVQTIKSAEQGSAVLERSEWEQAIEGDEPDLALAKDTALGPLLTDDIRQSLHPVFETRIARTSYHINENGTEVVVAVDDGQIVAADSSCPVCEIELELEHGNRKELFRIARDILGIVPAQLEVKSKPERGYELLARMPAAAELARDPELRAGISAGRAFTLIGRTCLRQMVANVAETINRNAEALHQLRVALRRLRAAISLFSGVVGDDRANTIKTELRWLARECGPARDLDTLLIEVLKPLRRQNAGEPGLVSISRMIARKRHKGYQQALDAVQSTRFRKLALDIAEWIEIGAWGASEDAQVRTRREMPIEIYADEQLSQRRKKIRRRGARIGELTAERLHRLRIQVKKTRYAAEFFSGVYAGKKAAKRRKAFRSSLVELQDCLGGINDIVTRKALFADIIVSPTRGLTAEQNRHRAFAAGLIMGSQQTQVQQLLERACKAYSRFDRVKPFWKVPRRRSAAPPPAPASENRAVNDTARQQTE